MTFDPIGYVDNPYRFSTLLPLPVRNYVVASTVQAILLEAYWQREARLSGD